MQVSKIVGPVLLKIEMFQNSRKREVRGALIYLANKLIEDTFILYIPSKFVPKVPGSIVV